MVIGSLHVWEVRRKIEKRHFFEALNGNLQMSIVDDENSLLVQSFKEIAMQYNLLKCLQI